MQKDVGSSLALDQNFSLHISVRLSATFFAKFFIVPKGSPFIFFLFCKRMDVPKIPRAPLLQFLALCDFLETSKKFRKKFRKNFPRAGTVEENT